MLKTCSYNNFNSKVYKTLSLSEEETRRINTKKCQDLTPPIGFKEEILKLIDEDKIDFYIKKYYDEILSFLDPEETYNKLNFITLLSADDNLESLNRDIVAAWFELFLNTYVPEVSIAGFSLTVVKRKNNIKERLEKYIKENYAMHDFETIHDAYLFNKNNKHNQETNSILENNFQKIKK